MCFLIENKEESVRRPFMRRCHLGEECAVFDDQLMWTCSRTFGGGVIVNNVRFVETFMDSAWHCCLTVDSRRQRFLLVQRNDP